MGKVLVLSRGCATDGGAGGARPAAGESAHPMSFPARSAISKGPMAMPKPTGPRAASTSSQLAPSSTRKAASAE